MANPPVNFSTIWKIESADAAKFEPLLRELVEAGAKFAGHLGATVLLPGSGGDPHYRAIVAFDSRSNFEAWRASGDCQARLKRAEAFTVEKPEIHFLDGMEAWVALPGTNLAAPDRWKTIIPTACALFPLVKLLTLVTPYLPLGGLPRDATLAITLTTACVLMTYVVMPNVTRLCRGWLYPGRV